MQQYKDNMAVASQVWDIRATAIVDLLLLEAGATNGSFICLFLSVYYLGGVILKSIYPGLHLAS